MPIPMKAGRPARFDYEYERNGVANLFMMFAPLEGNSLRAIAADLAARGYVNANARITTTVADVRHRVRPKQKADGKYKGRPEDTERNAGIASLLGEGRSWSFVQDITGCSRATVAKIATRIKQDGRAGAAQN